MKKKLFLVVMMSLIMLMSCQNEANKTQETDSESVIDERMVTGKQLVAETAEQLNQALLTRDQAALQRICAVGLSYGHSSGAIQNKQAFIDDVLNGQFQFISINTEDQEIGIFEDLATVRNIFLGKGVNQGDTIDLRIGTVQLYKLSADGSCRLVLRQGFKL